MSTIQSLLSARGRELRGDPITRGVLLVFGLYLLAVSLLAIIAPETFYKNVGPFGPANEHYTRDGATFELAIGLGALAAVRRLAWHKPMLWVLVMQSGFHALNHLADIQEADPEWMGHFDFIGLTLGTLILIWTLRRLHSQQTMLDGDYAG